ncbi:probable enoyl-CoA hydratase echA8 [Teleopsis dalmanni]|uniref:probable enoyl-CoA hydratase echA8 n=1 Tax=Teleopsis dalmanni TaxID=139649 RepID=UPI0018CEA82A|nr:probable enoyl-CoA hydratase echA8 [Teleopsis dalmanni]
MTKAIDYLAKCVHITCQNATQNRCNVEVLGFSKTFHVDIPAKEDPSKNTVLFSKDGNITLIGLNKDNDGNTIDAETAIKICDAFIKFESDDASPVAVLYGVGESFCTGFDILDLASDERSEISMDILMLPEGSVGPTRRMLTKPVVCAITGYCVASGMELALSCDQRVMETTAKMGFFNRRFGVPIIDGGTARLPAIIGISRALDLILTGRILEATEAYEIGVANKVVPVGDALKEAVNLAQFLSKFPQEALKHDRKSMQESSFEAIGFESAIQNEIMSITKEIVDEMQDGAKWFYRNFKINNTGTWMPAEMTMADWDNKVVVKEAAKVKNFKDVEHIPVIKQVIGPHKNDIEKNAVCTSEKEDGNDKDKNNK